MPSNHFESTETGIEDSLRILQVAKRHLYSAKTISQIDLDGSFQLLYDAARKSIQSVLTAEGFRITAAGGHYAYVKVAESPVFEHVVWQEFRSMRLVRNLLEYPQADVATVSLLDVATCATHVLQMITEVEKVLSRSK